MTRLAKIRWRIEHDYREPTHGLDWTTSKAAIEARMDTLRQQLLHAARRLAGARALQARLYGVGPLAGLAMTCWLGGAGRFSSSQGGPVRRAGCHRLFLRRQALARAPDPFQPVTVPRDARPGRQAAAAVIRWGTTAASSRSGCQRSPPCRAGHADGLKRLSGRILAGGDTRAIIMSPSAASLRALMTGLLHRPYSMNQASSYDLSRLARNGLIRRVPGRNRYTLTRDGLLFAHFHTKVYDHVLRPLMAPDRPNAPPELVAALDTLDRLAAGHIARARVPIAA